MTQATTNTLEVPGACLHYEVRGAGPALLLLGAPMPSGPFGALARVLAEYHTVVTYDPRGIGQSVVAEPDEDTPPEMLADDVHRLITALGTEPVAVFGNSGGATTGLALVSRHPEQVHTLVAHEPPLPELLPERMQLRAAIDEVCATYRSAGPVAARHTFLEVTGLGTGPTPTSGRVPPGMPANDHRFFAHMVRPFTRFQPDIPALQAAATRIVVGVGVDSAGQLPYRTAAALAERIGAPVTRFPGDHAGFASHSELFARTLREQV